MVERDDLDEGMHVRAVDAQGEEYTGEITNIPRNVTPPFVQLDGETYVLVEEIEEIL